MKRDKRPHCAADYEHAIASPTHGWNVVIDRFDAPFDRRFLRLHIDDEPSISLLEAFEDAYEAGYAEAQRKIREALGIGPSSS